MPPASVQPPQSQPNAPIPVIVVNRESSSPVGPIVGTVIIVILMLFGALYFWGDYLNRHQSEEKLPFIQGDTSVNL